MLLAASCTGAIAHVFKMEGNRSEHTSLFQPYISESISSLLREREESVM